MVKSIPEVVTGENKRISIPEVKPHPREKFHPTSAIRPQGFFSLSALDPGSGRALDSRHDRSVFWQPGCGRIPVLRKGFLVWGQTNPVCFCPRLPVHPTNLTVSYIAKRIPASGIDRFLPTLVGAGGRLPAHVRTVHGRHDRADLLAAAKVWGERGSQCVCGLPGGRLHGHRIVTFRHGPSRLVPAVFTPGKSRRGGRLLLGSGRHLGCDPPRLHR